MTTAQLRSQYHHGDLEHALITTARKMVRKSGADEISLRQIAQEIGVSPSAVYHYYPDRNSMMAALGSSLFEELADYQESQLGKITGSSLKASRERFRTLGLTYFQWAMKEPHFFNLMFSDCCLVPESDKSRSETRAFVNLSRCLDDLLNAGAISTKIRPYGELLSWSVVHGATSLIVAGHLDAEHYDEVLDGLELALGIRK